MLYNPRLIKVNNNAKYYKSIRNQTQRSFNNVDNHYKKQKHSSPIQQQEATNSSISQSRLFVNFILQKQCYLMTKLITISKNKTNGGNLASNLVRKFL